MRFTKITAAIGVAAVPVVLLASSSTASAAPISSPQALAQVCGSTVGSWNGVLSGNDSSSGLFSSHLRLDLHADTVHKTLTVADAWGSDWVPGSHYSLTDGPQQVTPSTDETVSWGVGSGRYVQLKARECNASGHVTKAEANAAAPFGYRFNTEVTMS